MSVDDKTITSNILLSFIILIVAIGIGYWLNTRRNGLEGFDGGAISVPTNTSADAFPLPPFPFANYEVITDSTSEDSNEPTVPATTMPQATMPIRLAPLPTTIAPKTLPTDITQQLDTISDATLRTSLESTFLDIQSILTRYSNLDVPIIMNDTGQICNIWGNYARGKYSQNSNECQALDNSGNLQCLNNANTPSRCSMLMQDGYINNRNTIDYKPFLTNVVSSVIDNIPITDNDITNMNENADTIIKSFADRSYIHSQQKNIIMNNNQNMTDKKKLIEKGIEQLGEKQNETNINQNNFSLFRNQISESDSLSSIYYKITLGLVITIIIIGILNFLFSNILA
jgi:hypothetical protein